MSVVAAALAFRQHLPREGHVGIAYLLESANRFLKEREMHMFPLEAVVMVQAPGIHDGHVPLAVAGDDLLSAGPPLLRQFSESRSNLIEGDPIFGLDAHSDSIDRHFVDDTSSTVAQPVISFSLETALPVLLKLLGEVISSRKRGASSYEDFLRAHAPAPWRS